MHSARFQQLGVELVQPYVGANGGGSSQGGSHDWSFHHPIADIDWIGNGTPIGYPGTVTPDYVERTVTAAESPYVDIGGANFAVNGLRGQKLIVVDDPQDSRAVGQVRRITWNTATRIYISGRWDFPPSATAKIVINPNLYGFARWHGNANATFETNKLVDWWT